MVNVEGINLIFIMEFNSHALFLQALTPVIAELYFSSMKLLLCQYSGRHFINWVYLSAPLPVCYARRPSRCRVLSAYLHLKVA